MKPALVLAIVGLASMSTPALAQDLYRAPDCGNIYKNPDANVSPDLKQKVYALFPSRPAAAGWIVSIGLNDALRDMRQHRALQCKLRTAGKAFEAQCPFGKTIIVDDYVDDALKQYAQLDNGSLQQVMERGIEDGRAEASAMMDACNDR